MPPSCIAALSYGVLTIIGGIWGYIKSRSRVSLISGFLSGVLLVIGALVALQGQAWGLILAAAVTVLLIVVFALRWWKTRKIMPAGLMVTLGILTFAVIIA